MKVLLVKLCASNHRAFPKDPTFENVVCGFIPRWISVTVNEPLMCIISTHAARQCKYVFPPHLCSLLFCVSCTSSIGLPCSAFSISILLMTAMAMTKVLLLFVTTFFFFFFFSYLFMLCYFIVFHIYITQQRIWSSLWCREDGRPHQVHCLVQSLRYSWWCFSYIHCPAAYTIYIKEMYFVLMNNHYLLRYRVLLYMLRHSERRELGKIGKMQLASPIVK